MTVVKDPELARVIYVDDIYSVLVELARLVNGKHKQQIASSSSRATVSESLHHGLPRFIQTSQSSLHPSYTVMRVVR